MPLDDRPPSRQRAGASSVHTVRAAVVVACFLVALFILLGPASHLTSASPTSSTTTTTIKHRPTRVVKSQTIVQVANGTSVGGLARHYTDILEAMDWNALPGINAATSPSHTIVYFARGYQAAADLVAKELGVSTAHVTLRDGATGVVGAAHDDVIVVLGPDLAG